ncbi:hypothetical protein NPIL_98801 [Nephila pilipes]|uniref:Uncharacterized protein n=1 Tax=Nephila pilipes TaxID=299642 RepID=A0A8X6QM28_NEPPI|nr:hypothetical protein NPIL_98801 [Nephila pilipes]
MNPNASCIKAKADNPRDVSITTRNYVIHHCRENIFAVFSVVYRFRRISSMPTNPCCNNYLLQGICLQHLFPNALCEFLSIPENFSLRNVELFAREISPE